MYCSKRLPNDADVVDAMVECDLKEVVSFFNKCKNTKQLSNWRDIKILCLNGISMCYSAHYDIVLDEIKKTKESV